MLDLHGAAALEGGLILVGAQAYQVNDDEANVELARVAHGFWATRPSGSQNPIGSCKSNKVVSCMPDNLSLVFHFCCLFKIVAQSGAV